MMKSRSCNGGRRSTAGSDETASSSNAVHALFSRSGCRQLLTQQMPTEYPPMVGCLLQLAQPLKHKARQIIAIFILCPRVNGTGL